MKLLPLLLVLACNSALAQNPFDKLKLLKNKLPNINKLLLGKDAITTSLDDAKYEVPEMDDFEPKVVLPGSELPRNIDGSFFMFPGVWEFHLKSYCMKAGTFGPPKSGGSGHLYAPLEGPKAEIIQALLKNGYKHPNIKQREIQVLIWAIIAKQSLVDMPGTYMLTAAQLLSPEQLLKLNDGVVRKFAQNEMLEMISKMPQPVKEVLEAENNMRSLLTNVNTKYEDLERVAMLAGVMPEDEGRKIKKGRWSITPQGYYIRYFANGYQNMTVQVYVKEDAYTAIDYLTLKNNSSLSGGKHIFNLKLPYLKIKDWDPSKTPAVPPARGQRLGPSNDKGGGGGPPNDRDDALDKAKRILGGADNAQNGLGLATDPLGTIMDKVNTFSPGNMFSKILDFITDNGRKISDALNADPPDADFTNFAKIEPYNFKATHQNGFKDPLLNQQAIDFLDTYLNAQSTMVALVKTNDKHGGAKEANDEYWTNKQAQAVIYYKKKVGDALLTACDKWELFLNTLQSKLATPILLKPENMRAYQTKLRTKGFDKDELETFAYMRLKPAEIEKLKAERLSYNPNDYTGNYIQGLRNIASAWKTIGTDYSKFPTIPAPW
jgi:hypothetical protein